MLDFLFRSTPKHTVCRIALSDNLNFKIENEVIRELTKYLSYQVTFVDKRQLIDEYSPYLFETKVSSMTSPMLEYMGDDGKTEIFSGFYPIIRFLNTSFFNISLFFCRCEI